MSIGLMDWLDSVGCSGKNLIIAEPVDIKDKKSDGSELVLMWFGDEQLDKSIQEIIIEGVGDIVWKDFADSFQF